MPRLMDRILPALSILGDWGTVLGTLEAKVRLSWIDSDFWRAKKLKESRDLRTAGLRPSDTHDTQA